jgi:hypothetical protein
VLEDAIISIADDLAEEIVYAFSLKEDQCGFIGDGTSTYGGIVGCQRPDQRLDEHVDDRGRQRDRHRQRDDEVTDLDLMQVMGTCRSTPTTARRRGTARAWRRSRSSGACSAPPAA